MIVVDASLVTKWFLNEVDSEHALGFFARNSGSLCGPDLLVIEVNRALVAAANMRRIDRQAARSAIGIWLDAIADSAVVLYPPNLASMRQAVDIALELGHPLGDCLYLSLALEQDCALVTCDAKFHAKANLRYPHVRLLAELS